MRLLTLLAGVPGSLKLMLTQEDRKALGGTDLRVYASADQAQYLPARVAEILAEAVDWLGERDPDEDFGMFLACAPAIDGSELALCRSFFPACAVAALNIGPLHGSDNRLRAVKNRFVRETARLRATHLSRAKVMREHLLSNARTTPLLLPLEKFDDTVLPEAVSRLSMAGGDSDSLTKSISTMRKFLEGHLDTRPNGNSRCFTARDLVFVPPGNHSEAPAHAMARAGEAHPPKCLLSGKMRLGAAFNPRFHYDCQPLTGNVAAAYLSCHGQPGVPLHKTYVNIAPNDFIR